MKKSILAAGAALAMLMAAPAFADSIDFAQFGMPGTPVSDGMSGTTNGGVGFTVYSPGASPGAPAGGFTEYLEDYSHTVNGGAYTWAGEFANGETILFDNFGSGLVTVDFAQGVDSIQDVEAQANDGGDYTATLTAYSGTTELGSVSYDAINTPGDPTVEGTIPNLSFFGSDITSFTIGTTNDGGGFALGGTGGVNNPPPPMSGAPEPSTWALLIAGVGGIGFAFRQARKKHGFSFAKALSA